MQNKLERLFIILDIIVVPTIMILLYVLFTSIYSGYSEVYYVKRGKRNPQPVEMVKIDITSIKPEEFNEYV